MSTDEPRRLPGLKTLLHPIVRMNPYPFLHYLRATDPVAWDPETEAWLVTSYADVTAVLRDRRFAAGWERGFIDALVEAGQEDLASVYHLLSGQMPFLNPPDHTRIRHSIGDSFAQQMIEPLRPRIQEEADALLAAIAKAGRAEIVRDLAFPLPSRIIALVLGIPAEDQPLFHRWTDPLADFLGTREATAEQARSVVQGLSALSEYVLSLTHHPEQHRRESLLGRLVTALDGGMLRTQDELLATCTTLLIGGYASMVQLIGNGLLALLRHPEQLARLQADPTLAEPAVEELLRYDSPVMIESRRVLEPCLLSGRRLELGQTVVLLLGAANRDPAQFSNPDDLDIMRSDNRHLAFGHGPHFCLGAPLARLEGQILFSTIVRRFPNLTLATDTLEWLPSLMFRGLASLQVTV